MEKRTILITGCSSGIGLCTAQRLKQDGYRVFATARKNADVERLKQQDFESFLLDYTNSNSIQLALQNVLDATGGTLYALFNNGAYGQPGAVEDLSREVLHEQFENNFFGWHELTNLVIPVMRKQGYGRIIQNSSILGIVAMPLRGAYNASKYAIEGLNDTLRLELHGSNVFVSMIEPGPISSRFRANAALYFKKNIDKESSYFKDRYNKLINKLETEGPVVPFTQPADAVYTKVFKALTAKRPKAHYYVTFPTYLFGYLKRILSTKYLDYLLRKV